MRVRKIELRLLKPSRIEMEFPNIQLNVIFISFLLFVFSDRIRLHSFACIIAKGI